MPEMRAEGWEDLSLWEQISLLPEEEQEEAIRDLIHRGVDLESYEVLLRPKQKRIIESPDPIILFQAGRGCGKEVALYTPVPTPDGWKKMGELEIGDSVFDECGQPTTVLAVYDQMSTNPVRLTFSDNTTIDAGGNHQWVTLTAMERKRLNRRGADIPDQWADRNPITTDELVRTLKYGKRGDTNHCIPVTKPLELPDADLPMDPWILGVWLGDGSSASANITCHEDDSGHYIDEMSRRGVVMRYVSRRHAGQPTCTWGFGQSPAAYDKTTGRFVSTGSAHSVLRSMGLLMNKHIPSEYFRGSVQQRLDLLRGLIDTDGHIDARGRVEFCSTNLLLAEGVKELAVSLGQKPVLSVGDATLNGRFISKKFRVMWRPTIVVATLPRKAAAHHPLGAQKMRSAHRMVVSAEPIPDQPMRCITVDSPNSMYLISEAMIPTHNTMTGSAWVNTYALEHPGCRIALVGRTVSDVRDTMVLGESGIVNKAPKDFVPIYTPSIRNLEWPNGSIATTYAAVVPDLMRGPQQDAAWCDELATFPTRPDASGATMWDNVVMATRLGDNPQILCTTTPKRVPILYRLEEMAKNNEGVTIVNGTSWENRSNLSKAYMDQVFAKYAGTYLERQELYGELIGDAEGALWNSEMIQYEDMPDDEELMIIIGVDPAVTVGGDDTGIVVVACDLNRDPFKRRAWVVDDYTMNDHVEKWAETVLEVQRLWSTTSAINPTGRPAMVVVEKDHGHDLLGVLFKNAGADLSVTPIIPISTKGQGKTQRAESIVLAYQQGRVKHDKKLPGLETEMTGWEPTSTKGVSPGHIDALVHALRTCLIDPRPIARWAPILMSDSPDFSQHSLAGIKQPWMSDRGVKTGMGSAPWRTRR